MIQADWARMVIGRLKFISTEQASTYFIVICIKIG